jgi:folate-binding protein YgfZ
MPMGGVDFAYGDAFPHEADMELFNGLDFGKGCYVGQEVVSRMKHRGAIRKRVIRYSTTGDAPPSGETIKVGDAEIGVTGSHMKNEGLALARLDRLAEAQARGETPIAGGVALRFVTPAS